MSSHQQIEHLINAYSFTIDSGHLEGFADLFRKGVWDIEGIHTFNGRDEVLAYLQNNVIIYDDGTPRTRHLATNVNIQVDDEKGRAKSQCYVTVIQQAEDFPLQTIISGVYLDEFARDDDGWYFTRRLVKTPLFGDMSRHVKVPE